ncbi:autotransporter outer membrane beta-barrel domain-containing protein [Zophobihabitans entericus]|uniref:Autotransporter outer membrane beta-barrel domain-containing protein n=1 Tax=Zophobihabitans entericus TaxID=1635327 RepID=A0A6G9ICQ2_9GAMM|nr:autotransporter outer membrane beta-barrel domain-containing protein [Zophobihabitans entericus]QIQ22011.1 autotransporter outer membrane beta-barrel domain-containing protein [Zophobihabitans entericus]
MNKVYKLKWNKSTQTFVVCSELSRCIGKLGRVATMVSMLAFPAVSFAVDCVPNGNGSYNPGGTGANYSCDNVPDSVGIVNVTDYYVLIDTGVHGTVTIGDINGIVTGWAGIVNRYASAAYGGSPQIIAGNVNLEINMADGSAGGIGTHSGVNLTAKDVALKITTGYSGGNSSGGVATYGVLVGSTVDSGEKDPNNNGKFVTITMDNLKLDQTVTGGKLVPVLNTGLRAIQGAADDSGDGYSGQIVVHNNLDMTLTGNRIEAIYVSGSATDASGNEATSQVVLNNSNIKLIQNSTTNNQSSVIKIGKARPTGTGKGAVYSQGMMNVDASGAVGDAIKLYETGSLLKADYSTSNTNVLANKSVLSVNSADWQVAAGVNAANDVVASFRNANFNTVSTTDSLVKVYGNADNFTLNISGDQSVLNAASNGWLIDVGDASQAASSATFNGSGGKYFGLSNVASNASLTMNLTGSNTVWYLKAKGTSKTATVTELNLEDGATLNASGTVTPGSQTISMHDGYTFQAADGSNLTTTALTSDNDFTLVGNVNNLSGVIDLAEEKDLNALTQYVTTLTIDGDYTGGSNQPTEAQPQPSGNGTLIVNTIWNNDNDSVSDSLHITGTATGYTEVKTKSGIIGNVTQGATEKYSVAVVTVDNHQLDSNAFYGFADTTGAGQAILVQQDANNYAWYLPVGSSTVDPIKPEIPAYSLMPRANMELGFNILGTLHQRIGEQQTMAWDDCSECQTEHNSGQIWGRLLGNYSKNKGDDRFGYRSKMWGLQFGYDFDINYDAENNSRRHTGMMLTYAKDNLKFNDTDYVTFDQNTGDYVSGNEQTGKGQSDMFALGVYSTYYSEYGSYLDLVGQIDYTRNKYSSIRSDNVKNNSYGLLLSAEVGRPFAIAQSQWLIEPQAQLTYQYRDFSSFKTFHDVDVDQDSRNALRGRVGFRLGYNDGTEQLKTQTVYFTANIIHDFIDSDRDVQVGDDRVKEKLARTWGELGLGLQLPIGEMSYIYSDVRYAHTFTNDDGLRREYQGNLGIKWHF